MSTRKQVTNISLLNIPEEGKKSHKNIVKECIGSAEHFEKLIRKHPLHTFASKCIAKQKAAKH